MGKMDYNSMYKSSFKEAVEEPKTLEEIKEELSETAPVEELPVEEAEVEVPEEKEEVKVEEKKEEKKVDDKIKKGQVKCNNLLNIRNAPNGTLLQTISNGEYVEIIDDSNPDWYKIIKPVKGYVKKDYIVLV